MSYTVKFHNPMFPEGEVIYLTGIGVLENGGSVELDEAAEKTFYSTMGTTLEEALEGNEMAELSGSSELTTEDRDNLLNVEVSSVNPVRTEVAEEEQEAEVASQPDQAGAPTQPGTTVLTAEDLQKQREEQKGGEQT